MMIGNSVFNENFSLGGLHLYAMNNFLTKSTPIFIPQIGTNDWRFFYDDIYTGLS